MATHSARRNKSDDSIDMDDMIEWSDDEEVVMLEENDVPHLLASLFAVDDMMDECCSLPDNTTEDDPLSLRDSVYNPSPLVLSVRKIYSDEEREDAESIESTFAARLLQANKVPEMALPSQSPIQSTHRVSLSSIESNHSSSTTSPADNIMSVCDSSTKPMRPRGRSFHRRDSVKSLPAPGDLHEVLMGLDVGA